MARRSARLQKHSPAPRESCNSNTSWVTADSNVSPQYGRLPSVIEGAETAMKTPRKEIVEQPATASRASKPTQLPQPSTATPTRTPSKRTPIKPAGEEMHPAHHHASTAKPLDEARWLGFQALGAHTAPPKPTGAIAGQDTPTRTPAPATPGKGKGSTLSSGFHFKFQLKSPFSGLSPTTNSILKHRKEAAIGEDRALFKADEFTSPADMAPKRKTVVPKGKMSRYSDVHMNEFKKMDSIANHASAFRADPNRFKLANPALKRSASKVDLDKPESSTKTPNKLKRTQSRMDLGESTTRAPDTALKRTKSKTELTEQTTHVPPTPLKRTQSKMDIGCSALPRPQSTVRIVPPSRNGRLPTQDGNPFAKRVKRTETDDAATTRPMSRDGKTETVAAKAATPARKITSQTALPRLAARLMTPTRSSIARSQSVKVVKTHSFIPSLLKSPSTNNMFSPTNLGHAMKEGVRNGFRQTSNSIQSFRSILRTPNRKFSEDRDKIAAGTHMSPPPGLDLAKALPEVPKTAPVRKHVNFTNSTLERAGDEVMGKSPSPMKFRAGSEVPTGAVVYPLLRNTNTVEYPAIVEDDESQHATASPSRRLTFGGATANTPGEFCFNSGKSIDFGPASIGTIRMVRKSNASSLVPDKKRKLDTLEEVSDKENSQLDEKDNARSAKKLKPTIAEPPQTPSKSLSKLPRRTPNRGGSISKSRLAFLSTPKRGKA